MNFKIRKRRKDVSGFLVFWLANFLLLFLCLSIWCGCKKERRPFKSQPMKGAEKSLQMSELIPGPQHPHTSPVRNVYENNAWGMSQGKQLYEYYNCVGCHAHGGGGMGPPLMDVKWIYGSNPEQVFATIMQGRPNGMPAFRRRIPEDQVWQIVAYVRSLGGLTNTGAENARDDHMHSKPPENSLPAQSPSSANIPRDHP
jgi:cytochrome c oxidase cbb3-type subunit III